MNYWSNTRGTESRLIDQLDAGDPSVRCLLSPLKVGDAVGRFVEDGLLLELGEVVTAHTNGLYDVELFSGVLCIQLSRTDLRFVPTDMKVERIQSTLKKLNPTLVHACVRPFEFGSYENAEIFDCLEKSGCALDEKDGLGNTPLQLARPGSQLQTRLRESTAKPHRPRSEKQGGGPPPLDVLG